MRAGGSSSSSCGPECVFTSELARLVLDDDDDFDEDDFEESDDEEVDLQEQARQYSDSHIMRIQTEPTIMTINVGSKLKISGSLDKNTVVLLYVLEKNLVMQVLTISNMQNSSLAN